MCIDLDGLTGRKDLQALRLSLDPGQEQLSVVKSADPVALIDTRTFAVRMADAALLLGAVVARTLRRRRLATSTKPRTVCACEAV